VTFDCLYLNPIPEAAGEAVASLFRDNPRYMKRGPFSYTDRTAVTRDLRAAGFEDVRVETIQLASQVAATRAAQGIVLGSPFRAEIERLEPSALNGRRRLSPTRSAMGRQAHHDVGAHIDGDSLRAAR
jgi:hypothetical protein